MFSPRCARMFASPEVGGMLFKWGVGVVKPHPLLSPRKGLKNEIVYFCKLLRYEELCKPY